ncbi:MAG: DUF5667 domain-containing protein [Alicyclobacillus sp.]|nr:DUF5667 domain-containing protein [Alicyclobacillus sp.]
MKNALQHRTKQRTPRTGRPLRALSKGAATLLVLVGVNAAGAVTAFADTSSQSGNTAGMSGTATSNTMTSGNVSITVLNNTSASNATGSGNATGDANATVDASGTTQTQASAGILPGSFFYFLKMTIENIRLALTFNDVNKAQLLASYAAQRIAEANALAAKGETTLAAQTLQQAAQDETAALKLAQQTGAPLDFGVTNGTGNNTVSSAGNAVGSVNITVLNDTGASSNASANSTADANGAANNAAGGATSGDEDQMKRAQVYAHLSQDTLALVAALQHVKNPTAQAALAKNIEKSLEHLEAALGAGARGPIGLAAASAGASDPSGTSTGTDVAAKGDTSVRAGDHDQERGKGQQQGKAAKDGKPAHPAPKHPLKLHSGPIPALPQGQAAAQAQLDQSLQALMNSVVSGLGAMAQAESGQNAAGKDVDGQAASQARVGEESNDVQADSDAQAQGNVTGAGASSQSQVQVGTRGVVSGLAGANSTAQGNVQGSTGWNWTWPGSGDHGPGADHGHGRH